MHNMRIIGVLLSICGIFGCAIFNNDDKGAFSDSPGKILVPAKQTKLLVGDTIEIEWENEIENPAVYYNYNDSMGTNYSDAKWHLFPDSLVISLTSLTARVMSLDGKWSYSENYRIKVADTVTGISSESGQLYLDHIILLQPDGGETYTIGEAVPIKFVRNQHLDRVYLFLTTGLGDQAPPYNPPWSVSLTPQDINFEQRNEGNLVTVFDTSWTIGEEEYFEGSAKYPSDSCFIFASSYYLGENFQGSFTANGPSGLKSDHNLTPFTITD